MAVILFLIPVFCFSASKTASINIGLTIKGINETKTTDGEQTEDGNGVAFSFMPSNAAKAEEQNYKMNIITNSEFELEYFWEQFETVDPRIIAYLNLDEEKYTSEFESSEDFNTFLVKRLTVGKNVGKNVVKNTIRKSKVKLESSELNLNPEDPLDFKVVYDPSILTGSYVEGDSKENVLRVIITFLPLKD